MVLFGIRMMFWCWTLRRLNRRPEPLLLLKITTKRKISSQKFANVEKNP